MVKIFVLVGPSGSGKDTLGKYLIESGIPELVSHTTREKRKGEIDGENYYFVDKKTLDSIDKIEYNEYAGNYYCLSRKELEEKTKENKAVFIIADINGMRQIKKQYPKETVPIFVSVTKEEMKERMKKRGDSEKNIEKRIENSVRNKELENGKYCDYVVRNDFVDLAIRELNGIIRFELNEDYQIANYNNMKGGTKMNLTNLTNNVLMNQSGGDSVRTAILLNENQVLEFYTGRSGNVETLITKIADYLMEEFIDYRHEMDNVYNVLDNHIELFDGVFAYKLLKLIGFMQKL